MDALSAVNSVFSFTAEQAKVAGSLIAKTEKYGLSLGDRSCLALAIALNAPVYTTETGMEKPQARCADSCDSLRDGPEIKNSGAECSALRCWWLAWTYPLPAHDAYRSKHDPQLPPAHRSSV